MATVGMERVELYVKCPSCGLEGQIAWDKSFGPRGDTIPTEGEALLCSVCDYEMTVVPDGVK